MKRSKQISAQQANFAVNSLLQASAMRIPNVGVD
jgi:hypothetical protein